MTQERLRPLPVQVRPQAGEGIRAYIVRLAHANHLPSRQKAYRRRNPALTGPKSPASTAGRRCGSVPDSVTACAPPPAGGLTTSNRSENGGRASGAENP
jgi:hypothetical protein